MKLFTIVHTIYINFPQCTSDSHCSMLHFPCHFVSFFLFENAVTKYHKNAANLFGNNLRKFQKFTVDIKTEK